MVTLMQAIHNGVLASLAQAVADVASSGALNGIAAGLVVGAIVWPIMQAPDTLGRVLVLVLLFAIAMTIFEVTRIGAITGNSLSSIVGAFQDLSTSTLLGRMILNAAFRVLIAMLIGAFIAVGTVVPGKVLIGGLIGLLLGVAIGALLAVILDRVDVVLNLFLFRILVALFCWGIFATVGGR